MVGLPHMYEIGVYSSRPNRHSYGAPVIHGAYHHVLRARVEVQIGWRNYVATWMPYGMRKDNDGMGV